MWRWCIAGLVLASGIGCKKKDAPEAPPAPLVQVPAAEPALVLLPPPIDPPHAHHGGPRTPLPVCRSEGLDPLSAARRFYEQGQHAQALACAAQASALYPDNPLSHSERGAALAALGQLSEAQTAYARALALDPDHLDALLGASHLYGVRLPSSREHDELASVYAEHGLAIAEEQHDPVMAAEFSLLSSMALNDLGAAREALERAEQVLLRRQADPEARYERAIALFELCRFADAKAAFLQLEDDPERGAHAHHHLGLLAEREGDWKGAERHLAAARKLAPGEFGGFALLAPDDFRAEVQRAVASLPADMQKDLDGIPVTAEELPADEDLLSNDPPLSPAILGLFRGPPLGQPCDGDLEPCRSVALYRRNLARAVRSRAELVEQIRVTLLHEIGHLRGEDDFELAARGLE